MSARGADAKLVLGAEPRVQLLPQSVRDRERAAQVRRRLAMFVVLALVLVGGAYAFAWMRNDIAKNELLSAQAETTAILADQSTYAEGTRAAALVDGIQVAQTATTANEVLWTPILNDIAAMMPEGTRYSQIVALGQAPWEPALPVEGPLRTSRTASILFSVYSPVVLDAAVVVPQLQGLTGYLDSRFDSSLWVDDEALYQTTIRVMFDREAVSARFGETAAEAGTEGDQ